jgi:KaiC/GvpD/RAD55 family RecA-like ATPase
MSLADSMLALVQPVSARLSSGLETLDRATRGGLPLGRVVTLVGAPGAGKTGLAVWFAEQWERAGAAVAFLAADEEPRGILTRIGQRMGFSRDDIEGPDDGVRRDLASQCVGRSVIVIDPDADESMRTIEDAHAALVHFACELPRVLIIDSLQTCLCAAAMSCDTIRERISTKMRVVKSFAKTGTLVVVISEMARAGYRSGDAKNDVSALAAGKESSDIEYGSALLLGLRSVRDTSGQTDVEVAKNRLGAEKPTFRLRLDFATAGWSEIATPAEPDKGGAAEDERDAKAEQIIRDVIAAHPGKLASQNAVLAVARGMKRAVMNRALGRLITIGDVRLVDSVYVVDGLGSTRGET